MLATFPLLAIVNVGSPIVRFFIIAVLIAVALYWVPKEIEMDPKAWKIIRIVVLVAMVLWGLSLFGII